MLYTNNQARHNAKREPESEMNFQAITAVCQKAEAMKDQITDQQARNAMENIRKAAGYVGIDPNSFREWHIEDGNKTIYDTDVSKDQAFQVIESVREWAQSWIDHPVQ